MKCIYSHIPRIELIKIKKLNKCDENKNNIYKIM